VNGHGGKLREKKQGGECERQTYRHESVSMEENRCDDKIVDGFNKEKLNSVMKC